VKTVTEDAGAASACITVWFCYLSVSQVSECEGIIPSWYKLQNPCFWRLWQLQANVVPSAAPCSLLQGIRMPGAPLQVPSFEP